ncbi:hypothetical protein HYU50_02790 [Candidatus Woesearchaeota archaeon]|nr:hypothetical protein [Candidatus Woesearchaeota archaeon]
MVAIALSPQVIKAWKTKSTILPDKNFYTMKIRDFQGFHKFKPIVVRS